MRIITYFVVFLAIGGCANALERCADARQGVLIAGAAVAAVCPVMEVIDEKTIDE